MRVASLAVAATTRSPGAGTKKPSGLVGAVMVTVGGMLSWTTWTVSVAERLSASVALTVRVTCAPSPRVWRFRLHTQSPPWSVAATGVSLPAAQVTVGVPTAPVTWLWTSTRLPTTSPSAGVVTVTFRSAAGTQPLSVHCSPLWQAGLQLGLPPSPVPPSPTPPSPTPPSRPAVGGAHLRAVARRLAA